MILFSDPTERSLYHSQVEGRILILTTLILAHLQLLLNWCYFGFSFTSSVQWTNAVTNEYGCHWTNLCECKAISWHTSPSKCSCQGREGEQIDQSQEGRHHPLCTNKLCQICLPLILISDATNCSLNHALQIQHKFLEQLTKMIMLHILM